MSGRVCTRRRRRPAARLRLALLAPLAAALALGGGPAAAQQPTGLPTTLPAGTPVSVAVPAPLRPQASGGAVALEGVVDADAYTVGPGDIFAFSIGGRVPLEHRATVTADGMLIVPELGSFRVAGRSLAAVRAELRGALRRRYSNVDTDAALAEPRRFVVHVSGAVGEPGRHAVVPVARLEDALAEAMGGSPLIALRQQQAVGEPLLPALRNVEVRHADGTTASLDLLRYYATGDIRYNPHLRDGDVVHVPTYHVEGAAVFVEDRLSGLTVFDLRPDDTVADLLVVARGPEAASTLEAVRLLRTRPDGSLDVQEFTGADVTGGRARTAALQPRDHLLLLNPHEEQGRVEVTGAVRFPGSYPLTEGATTLREVVALAGGLRPTALAWAAYLERRGPQALPWRIEPVAPFDAAERTARFESAAYEAGRLADLPFESVQYLARELTGYRQVSIDLQAVLAGTAPDVALRDGDRLVVPEDPGGVLVVGQVQRPGLIPYRPGADAEAYIAAAGGRGPAATEVYLRDEPSGVLRPARGVQIRSGDVLFVAREAAAFSDAQQGLLLQRQQFEAQLRRDRAESRNRMISTTLGIISTAVGALTLYIALTQDNTSGN